MKTAHRKQAKAKRARRSTHYVATYSLLDTLFAAPDAPMPADKRLHQLTRMHFAQAALETDPKPSADDWRVCSDAVNLMETLVVEMKICEDPDGLLNDAVAALALAGARHLQDGAPIRLTGEGIRAMRSVLSSYAEQLESLSARTMTECHRLTERRVHDILRGVRKAHDVELVAL